MNRAELPTRTILQVIDELQIQIKRPPPHLYCFPKNIRADYDLSKEFGDRQNIINDLAQNMCFYLGILSAPRVRLVAEEFYSEKDGQLRKDRKEQAGEYYVTRTSQIITITYSHDKLLRFEMASAIVAHECCHHYLHVHGIQSSVVDLEVLTDLTGVYLGLGFILWHGYFQEEKVLGYLSRDTLKRSLKLAVPRRKWDELEVKAGWHSMFQTKHRMARRRAKRRLKDMATKTGASLTIVLVVGLFLVWFGIYFVYLAPYTRHFIFEVLNLPVFLSIFHLVPMLGIPIISGVLVIWILSKTLVRNK